MAVCFIDNESKAEKGKLFERVGRKVMGLKYYDRQTTGFFCVYYFTKPLGTFFFCNPTIILGKK